MENNVIVKSVKYYMRVNGVPCIAVKLYKTADGKYHRFMAIFNKEITTKEVNTSRGTRRVIVSPKLKVTEYLKEFGDSWVQSGFVSELEEKFSFNSTMFIKKIMLYTYGINKNNVNYIPKRFEKDIKLFDWEFRMFSKPE